MSGQTKEARVIFAIEAIRTTQKLSRRRVAAIYQVPYETLRDRMHRKGWNKLSRHVGVPLGLR